MRPRKIFSLLFTAFAVVAITAPSLGLADGPRSEKSGDVITVEAQPLASALQAFSEQSGLQIAYVATLAENVSSKGTEGANTPDVALSEILDNTGLEYEFVNNDTVAIGPGLSDAGSSDSGNAKPASSQMLMAQNQTPAAQTQTGETKGDDDEEDALQLEKITVTGTHIRGIAPDSSPTFVFDREDIDASGYATAHEVVRTLPQNFGGGPSETGLVTLTNANEAAANNGAGTGVNLRGLGSDASLVLLNGHRIAPAGGGTFADVSMIPIGAVERIDVLLDGASSIYGSDAIGGVVNFVLRDDYEGAETRVRYGTVTDGGRDEVQIGQLLGNSWASGRALISLEYFDVSPLEATDRSFTKDAPGPTTLIPEQERKSAFLMASQELTERFKLFGDAFYSARDSEWVGTSFQTAANQSIETEQIAGTLGAGIEWGTWYGELTGAFSRNVTDIVHDQIIFQGGERHVVSNTEATTWSLDAKADGSVFQIPGGDIKLAVGGHYRQEAFEDGRVDEDRDILAVFGEAFFPIVGKENRVAGIERLELTASARHEDYSDVGTSTDPKVGVLWSPLSGLNLRASWGTSFRAPLFREVTVVNLQEWLAELDDPSSPTLTTLTAIAFGQNPDLQPEEASIWTAGIDYQPDFIPNLNIGLTYFSIDYKDRIDDVFEFFELHTNPVFAPLISRNPDPAFLALLGSQPASFNLTGPNFNWTSIDDFIGSRFEFTDAEALADLRLQNLANTDNSGLDLSVSYGLSTEAGEWGFTLNGSYLRKNAFQVAEGAEVEERLNSVSNPVDLKLRGGISWRHDRLAANLFINYTDSYEDIRTTPPSDVASWTTVDSTLRYNTGNGGGLLDNTEFGLNIHNLFDRDPPFVGSFFPGRNLNFDSSNASALGRFVSLQITKQW